ncbi:hypothetical protein XELAEV_18017607mg [Xenopus laevis]|uniref:Uncharacterized protein n=1 Tax=Xenopus laevis TaxID=8355 RepID=A0A974DBW3_XENLA|nr:hypothetical protein XELAEV_18017607mg [Xenopus laevis]
MLVFDNPSLKHAEELIISTRHGTSFAVLFLYFKEQSYQNNLLLLIFHSVLKTTSWTTLSLATFPVAVIIPQKTVQIAAVDYSGVENVNTALTPCD